MTRQDMRTAPPHRPDESDETPFRHAGPGDLEDRPEVVLSVLEADQLVTAKERVQFGRARLSRAARALLTGLRLYVIIMMITVAIQVLHAVRGGH